MRPCTVEVISYIRKPFESKSKRYAATRVRRHAERGFDIHDAAFVVAVVERLIFDEDLTVTYPCDLSNEQSYEILELGSWSDFVNSMLIRRATCLPRLMRPFPKSCSRSC